MQALSFEAPDSRRFPGLQLAWEALAGPVGSSAVLNAANEEGVAAFLAGTLRFTDIHTVNARTVEKLATSLGSVHDIDDLLEIDRRARRVSRSVMQELAP